ncbi:MAG: methyltransferase domain-containing protein [Thermoleophilaceae bacterium]|nr:methyltransferase domain-containing protein [Thermoleophilaceae bacterium]
MSERPSAGVRDWDAETYDRVSAPQVEWGAEVLARLELEGDETVLDAGCGSGRVTRLLLERLPRGRVIAVDSAPSMVEEARTALAGERAEVFACDLTELSLDEPVDVVFSTAVFHWIADHDRLFSRIHEALRPGGRLVAQCGGAGNVRRFHELARGVGEEPPFAEHLAGWAGPWHFASPEDTSASLEGAGFTEIECWLEPREVTPAEPREFIRTVCLGHHLDALPEELRDPYLDRVIAAMDGPSEWGSVGLNIDARRPGPSLDYVRLNMAAKRP